MPPAATAPLIDITRISAEPAALDLPRGREMAARWPDAEIVPVESHRRIPEVHGDEANVRRWVRIEREALVLGVKKSITVRPNGRSADFIAPSTANGCAMACAYCDVPRRKGYSNPITAFTDIEQIMGGVARHVRRQGVEPEPNQCDAHDRVCTSARTANARRRRARPGRPLHPVHHGEGVVRHQVREPRPAAAGPAAAHPGVLLADAGGGGEADRHRRLDAGIRPAAKAGWRAR